MTQSGGVAGAAVASTASAASTASTAGGVTSAPRGSVTVRYWAAARAAAGVDAEPLSGATVGEVVDAAVARHPELGRVAGVATFLLDGRATSRDAPVTDGAALEVLPPFAGG